MPYPLATDLQAFLLEAGLNDVSGLDLAGALDDAVDAFETDTECRPFLASPTPSSRTFDAPGMSEHYGLTQRGGGRLLPLGCGLLEFTSLVVDEVEWLLRDRSFWLEPNNAAVESEPYTLIRFGAPVYAPRQSVIVTGRWGYMDELAERAKRAILARAAMQIAPLLANRRRLAAENATAQVKAKDSGPVRIEYQTLEASKVTDFSALAGAWSDQYASAARKYRIVS